MLGEMGIAANDRRHDLRFALPSLVEREAGAYESFPQLGSYVRHFLAADVGEELVDVMYNTITHVLCFLLPVYLALRRLKPISLVAPVMTWSSASMEPSGRREPAWPPAILST